MGALALTETANPLIWSPTKTRLNPATVSRVIPMRVAKARFEPKPVDAADRTFRRYGREAHFRCGHHQGLLCGTKPPMDFALRMTAWDGILSHDSLETTN